MPDFLRNCPTPWVYSHDRGYVVDANGERVTFGAMDDLAIEEVVLRVNTHAALLDAAEAVEKWWLEEKRSDKSRVHQCMFAVRSAVAAAKGA